MTNQNFNEKLLIVDDEKIMRDLLGNILGSYPILAAKDAEEALELFDANKVFCVISDFCMPGISGLRF